ncbi:TPA: MarR family winged helix-turn-helix transcriptional regulator [Pseudomonas aeruginosa]
MESERPSAKPRRTTKVDNQGASVRKGKAAPILEDENWDLRLGFLMHDVSRLRRMVFDDFMRPLGITRSQWWVLAYLSRHDGMIQSDLANALDLGKAALGGLIDRLEAAGFIERRPDGIDRRAKRIYLSPSGTQMIKKMTVLSHEMSERILVGLNVKSRQKLAELLMTVKRNLLLIKQESSIGFDNSID